MATKSLFLAPSCGNAAVIFESFCFENAPSSLDRRSKAGKPQTGVERKMESNTRKWLVGMAVVTMLAGAATGAPENEADSHSNGRLQEGYGKLPLQFEENHGQTDSRVKFLARGAGYTLFLAGREATLALRHGGGKRPGESGANLRMVLEGASAHSQMTASEPLPGKVNYFRGNDTANWRTGIRTWQR
jgi:hypothetical protein